MYQKEEISSPKCQIKGGFKKQNEVELVVIIYVPHKVRSILINLIFRGMRYKSIDVMKCIGF